MLAGRLRQTGHAASVGMNAIDVGTDDGALGAGEVDPIVVFVDAVEHAGFPWPVGDLLLERSVSGVLIDMEESTALAEPQERAVLEECHLLIVIGLDPRLSRFAEESLGIAAVCIDRIDVEPRLFAIGNLIEDL